MNIALFITSRSFRPTDVLWPGHALLGSPASLRKYLAVLKLLTEYVFADPYMRTIQPYYIKFEIYYAQRLFDNLA